MLSIAYWGWTNSVFFYLSRNEAVTGLSITWWVTSFNYLLWL